MLMKTNMLDRLYTYRRLALIAVFSLVTIGAFAQDDWDNDGEIEDVEIEIVKDREIKLPRSSRNCPTCRQVRV